MAENEQVSTPPQATPEPTKPEEILSLDVGDLPPSPTSTQPQGRDLNVGDVGQGAAEAGLKLGPPQSRHLWVQELVRASYALILVGILAGTIWAGFLGANGAYWMNVKDLMQLVLPAVTALLGSAAGFYFGSTRGDR